MEITHITPDSQAEETGIVAGDRIISVNGQKVRDFLDLHLWLGEEELNLTLEHQNVYGQPFEVTIIREYGRELGFTFEPPRIRRCANDCPFCFVDQLPDNVRSSLRIRDDDYRFSYMYGHFVTLTNLKEWEFQRIIDQQLSPLYISVHALDPDVREECLASPRAREIKERLEQLLDGGIEMHTQVVAIPNLNDGDVLEETVFGLAEYYPGVLSCSVVPVGLTGYREGLAPMRTYTQAEARAIVAQVEKYGEALHHKLGDSFVHAADEFVILAGLPIPDQNYYGDFSQVENGIGIVRQWIMGFEGGQGQSQHLKQRGIKRVLVVTGESFGPLLEEHTKLMQDKNPDIGLEVLVTENKLFGRPVTVAGLLGGSDILRETAARVREGDLVLVPNECLNPEGYFLDDKTLQDIENELRVPVEAHWDSLYIPEELAPRGAIGIMSARLPLVAVVGRPNVGKSTLYNRVVPRGDAVVDDEPGVTRDRREGEAAWNGIGFRMMDTGGLVPGTKDHMEAAIYQQGEAALDEADVVLFVVDAREGLTALDEDIAQALRHLSDKIMLVANKIEGTEQELNAHEFTSLGFSDAVPVSAQHGQGVGDMLDVLIEKLPKLLPEEEKGSGIYIAIVGKPNVGKSSIANRLLGTQRFIVHDEAGTTRDAVDAKFKYDGSDFVLVDTAGLRRRSHVSTGIEYYSTVRTRRSLMRSDVALVVLDASEEIAAQDMRVAAMATDAGKSVIFIMNKWDRITKVTGTAEAYERMLRDKFPHMKGCPVLFTSAETGQRIQRIPELARTLWEERRRRIPTSELNAILKEATENFHPTVKAGTKPLKLYYVTQTGQEPPAFVVFVNDIKSAAPNYRKYLKNYFTEKLGFTATPVRFQFRGRR